MNRHTPNDTGSELATSLASIVGPAGVTTAPEDLEPHVQDWRGRFKGRAACLVRPASTAEVAAVIGHLAARGVPVVPQGGNTSLCGGATPDESGQAVVLSLSRMNRIRSVDAFDNLITVESGCILERVQEAAQEVGRLFPLSLAAEGTCQIGGNISTNAGGTAVLRYGMTRDLVLGLEVVLPSGEVLSGPRGLRKDNTGYDLKQLFIGAEGTLGVITAATLKLFPRPREVITAMAAVADLAAAVKLLRHLQEDAGDNVITFELISDVALDLVLQLLPGHAPPFPRTPPFSVLLEVASFWRGFSAADAVQDSLARASEAGLCDDAVVARDDAQAQALWRIREDVPEAERRSGTAIKHDVSVRPGLIPTFVDATRRAVEAVLPGAGIILFGHLGDGSLHLNVVPPGLGKARVAPEIHARVWRAVHDVVTAHEGSISAEHGIGQLKRDELWHYRAALDRRLMRAIKDSFDPRGLMNPGKVV
jgi:FAD/FMN-containing dehydrogenase